MTSVLVVDDSRYVRSLVGSTLTEHGYEVGTASDGHEAVRLVEATDPDVVTMDLQMPGIDGIETVERIMATNPTPVVMLSAHTAKGAEATIRALARGAVDFLHKPGSETDVDIEDLEENLVRTIEAVEGAPAEALVVHTNEEDAGDEGGESDRKRADELEATLSRLQSSAEALSEGSDGPRPAPPQDDPIDEREPPTLENAPGRDRPPTVVLGASTGGPNIVETILAELPVALGARVLVVQHMPPSFTDRLAAHLDDISEYAVAEATDGATVGPGECLVAKGDYHMRVTGLTDDDRLEVALTRDERVHSVRPAVDVTMGSVVEFDAGPLVGVVLTGMGKDGAVGVEAMKSVGATTFVQDEATSPVFSMPRSAIETGCVDQVLSPGDIPGAICTAVREREREEAHV